MELVETYKYLGIEEVKVITTAKCGAWGSVVVKALRY